MRAVGTGLVVAALVAAGACGGDDGGGERLTAEQVASRGDRVCNRFQGEVSAVAAEFPSTITFTPDQMQQLWQKLLPRVDAAIADFEELRPPEELEDELDAAVDQAKQDRRKLADAAESPEAAKALFDAQVDPFAETNQKLAAVGITACSDDEGLTEGDAGEGADAATTTAPAEETTTSAP